MKLLIVEDHRDLLQSLKLGFTDEGYSVDTAANGGDALGLLSDWEYDAVILDVMLPEMDGISLLKNLRGMGKQTPVILLTAKTSTEDKITGLEHGADDYLAKPFDFEELLARVRALIRRSAKMIGHEFALGDCIVDSQARTVSLAGETVELTRQEFQVLMALALRRGRVLSREFLLNRILEGDAESNILDVVIYQLRKKIGKSVIQTRRGQGYMIS